MRIALSVLVGLVTFAVAAGFYYWSVPQFPTIVTTPQVEQPADNPAASSQPQQPTEQPAQPTEQPEQKSGASTEIEQPVLPVPPSIPPTPLPPRIVQTERIKPLPDGADGTMAQQGNATPASAPVKTKKHRKRVAHPKKPPLKTTPGAPTR
jgi:hypothetical protein